MEENFLTPKYTDIVGVNDEDEVYMKKIEIFSWGRSRDVFKLGRIF